MSKPKIFQQLNGELAADILLKSAPSVDMDASTKKYVDDKTSAIVTDIWYAGTTPPSNGKLLWIDTSSGNGNGIIKYLPAGQNASTASNWIAVSAIYT